MQYLKSLRSRRMQLFLMLCGILPLSAGIQPGGIKQDTGLRSTAVGQNVTLHCVCENQVAMHFSWYRQPVGGRLELLSSFYKFDETLEAVRQLERNPRFFVAKSNGVNDLLISNVQLSDSATYYCGSSHANVGEFGEGVFLSVEGGPNAQEIVQEPASSIIQLGDSVTFNCTVHSRSVDGEHTIYWFRHGALLGALHAGQSRCEDVSSAGSALRRCVSHLEKMNVSPSDAGIYYCAVASCGEILFGPGSKLFIDNDHEAQIKILAWLAIYRTGVVFVLLVFSLFVCVKRKISHL